MPKDSDILPLLQTLPFWSHLAPQEQTAVQEHAILLRFEQDSVIHSKNSECLGLILVLSGTIRTSMISEEGREITLFRMGRGAVEVLSASCVVSQITFDTQMTAATACRLLVLPAQYLQPLKENNIHVRCFIFERISSRFSDVMWTMQQVLFARVDQRVAAFLLTALDRGEGPKIRVTHAVIAQEINSVREVVARIMKRLAEERLVRLRRGSVEVLDVKGLQCLVPKECGQ